MTHTTGENMEDAHFKTLSESLGGLVATQSILFQYLIHAGIVDEELVAKSIDRLIDEFEGYNSLQAVTIPIRNIRSNLEKNFPDFPPPPPPKEIKEEDENVRPDWLHGIIDGGKK
jgi:hypothetical protein